MRFLLAILLPITVLAQGLPVGNPAGVILGIFAMCGTDPVDCGNGWCCLAGQTCTNGPLGADTMCNDPTLLSGKGVATVNAAYFGKLQDHQTSPPGNGTTGITTQGGQPSGNSAGSVKPSTYVLVSTLIGTTAILLSAL